MHKLQFIINDGSFIREFYSPSRAVLNRARVLVTELLRKAGDTLPGSFTRIAVLLTQEGWASIDVLYTATSSAQIDPAIP